ncbi:hypothetical protein AB0K93_09135 [Streptomyces sp. NPDC052676]|uniref:hypothetical protein n=1 Tax=Streptomyces sp. NPDC052676 TaxID=3154953 RepID=UPI00343927C4
MPSRGNSRCSGLHRRGTTDDAFRKAVGVDWQIEARDLYVKRLREAKEIADALSDAAQNIFIASGYLAQLKAESGFAHVPPEQMTRAQTQELAARYNGGPYYEDPDAQGYGQGFDRRLDQAKEALK